jgi:hypothetical protein
MVKRMNGKLTKTLHALLGLSLAFTALSFAPTAAAFCTIGNPGNAGVVQYELGCGHVVDYVRVAGQDVYPWPDLPNVPPYGCWHFNPGNAGIVYGQLGGCANYIDVLGEQVYPLPALP